jgi:hypothetical protein
MVETKKGTALQDMTGKLEFAEDNMVLNEEFKKGLLKNFYKFY